MLYLNWYSVYAISHNAATVEIRPTGKKVFVCNKVASSNTDYKYCCMTGKQRYANISGKQNLKEIFGSYGLSNIFFPYNGLIGTRDLHGKYELKQV
ncbi:hypothetical protein ANTPLA_LOCUS9237 [Anthophora plagiata]